MWIFYRFVLFVPLIWAKENEHQIIQKEYTSRDIKNIFYSHPGEAPEQRIRNGEGKSRNSTQFITRGKFSSPTGWVTKCRGLECVSTASRSNANPFLTKALNVLDKYTPLRSSHVKYHYRPESSLAKALATTSGVEDTDLENYESKTETKKSHAKINKFLPGSKRQGWFNLHRYGARFSPMNLNSHGHNIYISHLAKPIHVMDPAYTQFHHGTAGNAGAIAHFHQALPYPQMFNTHVFRPHANFNHHFMAPVHHHRFHSTPVFTPHIHHVFPDGPVPPYPAIPYIAPYQQPPVPQVPAPLPVQHVPVPVPIPVPGPPQPLPVPFRIPSPPEIRRVPYPVPYPVPSPPKIKEIPIPVRIPVRQPSIIQRFFYPVRIPQPGQVHHIPFPIYIRQPPQVRPVPYFIRVPSPPERIPIAVPSPPKIVVQRVPYPVMVRPMPVYHHHQQYIVEPNSGHCNINPCTNGGTCTAFKDSYRCHCPVGFKGVHCEEQSKCHPNPCSNLGLCTEVEKDYECTCQPGYKGTNCETPDPCTPSPCKNSGICAPVGNSYTCECRIGWIGKDCGIEAKCLPINPCQNGGVCTEALGAYHCNCLPGWEGISCEISASSTQSDMTPSTITASTMQGVTSPVITDGCGACHPKAYCDQDRCVCNAGYLGDGYICEIHDSKQVSMNNMFVEEGHNLESAKRGRVPGKSKTSRHQTQSTTTQEHSHNDNTSTATRRKQQSKTNNWRKSVKKAKTRQRRRKQRHSTIAYHVTETKNKKRDWIIGKNENKAGG